MRKVMVLLLSLLLLITVGALAEPTPSNVAITIDGVRTAFFDDAGNYLSPLEENGIIYVPVQQLAEGLGLDVTTDVEKLAVTLNGVRTAFFAEDGTYLPPLNVNGILYVPLDAFIESAGIEVEKEDGKYGFARNGSAFSAAAQTATRAPPEESKQSTLVDLLTSETWVEVFAPDNRLTFYADGSLINDFSKDGEPVSNALQWEASGDKKFDLINPSFFFFRTPYEIVNCEGLLLLSIVENNRFFARESEFAIAQRVVPTPTPIPTATPVPSPTPLPTMIPIGQTTKSSDFLYGSNGKEIQINKYVGQSGNVVIPEKIDGLPVTKIADSAFSGSAIKSIHFPSTLLEIESSAFAGCSKLSGVIEIPKSVKRMGTSVFAITGITGIIISSDYGPFTATLSPFYNIQNVEFLYIRKGYNPFIGRSAFLYDQNLKIAVIPVSVQSIQDTAFSNCNSLKIITPAGSAADIYAREHFIPVENDTYEQYVELFEATYPDPEKQSPATIKNSGAEGIVETETNPSDDKQKEVLYQRAAELLAAKDIDGAAALFVQIRGYNDVEDILKKNKKLKSAVHALATAPFRKVGGIVTFGHYEQDNDSSNGPEPIEWVVLDAQKNKVLLISRYGLNAVPYNNTSEKVTWEKCTLRTWLNGLFFKSSFTEEEQQAVLTTQVDNSKKQGRYDINGGKNTKDKIFLLSYKEAWKHFNSNSARLCVPTEVARIKVQKGGISRTKVDGKATAPWWLRSPGSSLNWAGSVGNSGDYFGSMVINQTTAVRPAFWLDLNSDLF